MQIYYADLDDFVDVNAMRGHSLSDRAAKTFLVQDTMSFFVHVDEMWIFIVTIVGNRKLLPPFQIDSQSNQSLC